MEWYWPEKRRPARLQAEREGSPASRSRTRRSSSRRATRPVIYAGGGILKASASRRAAGARRAHRHLPVVTTLMARGAMPDAHPLCLGMPGMHGNYTAVTSMQKSDLLITLGARFDDRVTGDPTRSRPTPRSSTSTSTRPSSARSGGPTCRSSATAKSVIDELIKAVKSRARPSTARPTSSEWITQLNEWQDRFPLQVPAGRRRPVEAAVRASRSLRANTPDDCILVAGVGQHQMWASQLWKFTHPEHVDQLGRPRHDGLRRARGGRRQGRPARSHGVGDRRRRLLPDDRAGARDRERPSAFP